MEERFFTASNGLSFFLIRALLLASAERHPRLPSDIDGRDGGDRSSRYDGHQGPARPRREGGKYQFGNIQVISSDNFVIFFFINNDN